MSDALSISSRCLIRTLLGVMCVLHSLNLPAQIIVRNGSDSLAATTFVQLFQVNNEGLLPTWYSAATLLLCAVLLALIAASRPIGDGFRAHWRCLALIFLFISVDEATGLHDMFSEHAGSAVGSDGIFRSFWVIPAIGLLVLFAAGFRRFVFALPPATRRGFVIAGSLYVGGALGFEMIGGLHDADALPLIPYAVLATLEELFEMTGILLFLRALLDVCARDRVHMQLTYHAPSPDGVTLRIPMLRRVAACVIGAILIGHIAVKISEFGFGHARLMGVVPLLDLNGEQNVPTWISYCLLLACAALLAIAARAETERRRTRYWWSLSAIFVLLSIDEAASLHELGDHLRGDLDAGGIWFFPWVIAGLAFVAIVGLLHLRFVLALPRDVHRRIFLAGTLFVGGALGLEMVQAVFYDRAGAETGLIAVFTGIEEVLEVSGVALMCGAVLRYLTRRDDTITIGVDLAAGAVQTPAATRRIAA